MSVAGFGAPAGVAVGTVCGVPVREGVSEPKSELSADSKLGP